MANFRLSKTTFCTSWLLHPEFQFHPDWTFIPLDPPREWPRSLKRSKVKTNSKSENKGKGYINKCHVISIRDDRVCELNTKKETRVSRNATSKPTTNMNILNHWNLNCTWFYRHALFLLCTPSSNHAILPNPDSNGWDIAINKNFLLDQIRRAEMSFTDIIIY